MSDRGLLVRFVIVLAVVAVAAIASIILGGDHGYLWDGCCG